MRHDYEFHSFGKHSLEQVFTSIDDFGHFAQIEPYCVRVYMFGNLTAPLQFGNDRTRESSLDSKCR
jgi:hypothetical protein